MLVSDSTDEVAQARLKAVAELRDGFELAERDFELRREGDVLGLAQSGLPRLRVASLQDAAHRDLAVRARAPRRGAARRRRTARARRGRPSPPSSRPAGCGASRPPSRRAAHEPAPRRDGPWPDAGRVIAGIGARASASRRPARARDRSATASSRRSSRSSSRTCRAPASSTCSPAAARPGSRRCRAAPASADVRRARPAAPPRSSTRTSRATRLAGPARHGRPLRTSLAWLRRVRTRPTARSTSSSSTRRTPRPSCSAGARGARRAGRAARARRPASSPSTSGATRRRPRIGLLASERDAPLRRDGPDLLPAPGGSMNSVAVYPGSFDPITNGHLDIIRAGRRRVRPGHRRRPRQPAQGSRCCRSTTRIADHPRRARARPARRRTAIEVEAFDGLTVDFCRARRRRVHRPRPARDQRLRDRDAARPQQPGARAATSTRSSS